MASISTDKKGKKRIQFVAPDGKRKTIRLGKMPKKAVEAIKTKVEALNAAAIAGISWDRETAEWVGGLDSVLYGKLAAVGLVPKRAEQGECHAGGVPGWLHCPAFGREARHA